MEEAAQMIADKMKDMMADRPAMWISLTFRVCLNLNNFHVIFLFNLIQWCLEVLSQFSQQNANRKGLFPQLVTAPQFSTTFLIFSCIRLI